MIKTTQYLKELKTQLKTNELVHRHLLDKHKDKLVRNGELIDELLNVALLKDKVITALKC